MTFLFSKYLRGIINFSIIFANLLPFNLKPVISNLRDTEIRVDYLNQIFDSDYILGQGDVIEIILDKNAIYKTEFAIDVNGTINLPRINRVYVSGLTINELTILLNQKFKDFLLNPECKISILKYRPIKVFLKGELNKPGIYTLTSNQSLLSKSITNTNLIKDTNSITDEVYKTMSFPTLFDVLKQSGGITIFSDLENIKITRVNSISNGGGKKYTNINFLEVFETGDLKNNIRLQDGDIIEINKSDKKVLTQIKSAIETNLNPDYVNVVVSGRVENPGPQKIYGTPTLNEALTVAGGTKTLKGKVTFVRFDKSGEIIKRKINYSPNAKSGSYKNPYLQNNDLIFVGKSAFNVASEVITETTQPFTGIFSVYALIKAFQE